MALSPAFALGQLRDFPGDADLSEIEKSLASAGLFFCFPAADYGAAPRVPIVPATRVEDECRPTGICDVCREAFVPCLGCNVAHPQGCDVAHPQGCDYMYFECSFCRAKLCPSCAKGGKFNARDVKNACAKCAASPRFAPELRAAAGWLPVAFQ